MSAIDDHSCRSDNSSITISWIYETHRKGAHEAKMRHTHLLYPNYKVVDYDLFDEDVIVTRIIDFLERLHDLAPELNTPYTEIIAVQDMPGFKCYTLSANSVPPHYNDIAVDLLAEFDSADSLLMAKLAL